MTIADIYEAVYVCPYDTAVANAFRKAVGLPWRPSRKSRVAYERESSYAGVDFEKLMRQGHGVRLNG